MTALVKKADIEFGKALVAEATEKSRKELQDRVVGHVTSMLNAIDKYKAAISKLEETVEHFEGRIEALNHGEFTIVGSSIKFDEEELNKDKFNPGNLETILNPRQVMY